MMNFLLVTEDFPPMKYGISEYLSGLFSELSNRKNNITVLVNMVHNYEQYDRKQNYNIIRYKMPKRFTSLCIGWYLLRIILREKPDVLLLGHAFGSRGLPVLFISMIFRIPFAVFVHGGHLPLARVNRINKIALFFLIKCACFLIANSMYTRNILIEKGISKKRIKILHPGVDIDFFSPIKNDINHHEFRQLYCNEDTTLIVTVARLNPIKNHIRIIESICENIKKGNAVKYVIAGAGSEYDSIKKEINTLGIDREVILIGNLERSQIRDLVQAADILIYPSTENNGRYESFGIAALEAASCGKPVIVGSFGGQKETIIHNKTGFMVDPLNTHEIAMAIDKLINDKSLAKKFGTAGRNHVLEEFSWKKVAIKAEKIFEQLYDVSL